MKRPERKIAWIAVMVVVVFAVMCFACGHTFKSRPNAAPPQDTKEAALLLYCGAGIQPAAEALTQAFSQAYSVPVNVTCAGHGRLLGQWAASQVGDEVCRESQRVQRTLGMTTIHISHNQRKTSLLADHVGVMAQGHLTRVTSGDKGNS